MRRWMLALLALLVVGGLGLATRAALESVPPTTIEDAVATTLRRAGAPTTGLRIGNAGCRPARETCLSYIADVYLAGERPAGRLACATAWRRCTLTMAELGLRAAPVPDVGEPSPLLATIGDLLHRAAAWAQSLVR